MKPMSNHMKQSHEVIWHSDGTLVAAMTQVQGWVDVNNIEHRPFVILTLETDKEHVFLHETVCDMTEAKRWVAEQFEFPSSILLLKFQSNQ